MSNTPTTEQQAQIAAWNEHLRNAGPEEVLRWAAETFGERLTLACSFGGVTGMALLDMAAKVAPGGVRVFYVDTEFLFPETYKTRDLAARRYGVTPLGFRAKLTPEEQADRHGESLWERDPDLCCAIRKVEPNARALEGMDAWIAGLRRDQSTTRAAVEPVQWDARFGLFKVCPLWNWTEDDVWDYIGRNRIPVNPLHAEGYASIGCTHCTRAIGSGEDLRAGRWSGTEKVECGLHK
jgi:phosphoadenosine phosphosulfate reductase